MLFYATIRFPLSVIISPFFTLSSTMVLNIFYTKIAYFIELSSLVSTLCAALVSILYANIDILLSVSLSIILVKLVLIRVYSFLSVWITALAAHLHGNHLGGIKKMIDACFGCSFFHVIMFWTIFCTVLYMGCLLLFVFICNAVFVGNNYELLFCFI